MARNIMSVGTKLALAISDEDSDLFFNLLDEVNDANELNNVYDTRTPLSLACMMDKKDFVFALLRKGADVNLQSGQLKQCALHHAANHETGRVRCVELLYEYGADLDVRDSDKSTALHFACTMGNKEVFNFLLKNGANLNLLDLDMETPLIRAILARNQYMIESLISAGCDVNYPHGEPLEYLIKTIPPMMECIHLFMKHGADLNKHTYLIAASAYNNIEMMKILESHGISVNATSHIFNFTALHNACVSHVASHEAVELLLEYGADVDVISSTFDTPLHYACQHCNLRKVLALLEYNPDVNRKDSSHMTPLTALLTTRFPDYLRNDYFKIGKLLIAAGTRLSKTDIELIEKEIPVTLSSVETEQQILEFLQRLKEFVNQPVQLQDHCRQKIRSLLGSNITQGVLALPLPRYLKNFLTMKDII